MTNDKVLIWRISRKMYWKPHERGYSPNLWEAGLYERKQAKKICDDANSFLPHGLHEERIIELDEAFEALQRHIKLKNQEEKPKTHCWDCGDLLKGKFDSVQRGECFTCFKDRKNLN